jgi:predicted nucleic acid-binding protein
MQKTIISDTSCLILLDKISALEILKTLFGEIIITPVIAEEFATKLPDWIKIKDVKNKNYQNILQASLDKGEASAIALAVELDECLLIIDDQKARIFAFGLGLKYTGTLGVLVDAKLSGHIASVKPYLTKIKQTNFRLTPDLEKRILNRAGE